MLLLERFKFETRRFSLPRMSPNGVATLSLKSFLEKSSFVSVPAPSEEGAKTN